MREMINFIVGDYFGDGHGKYENIQMYVELIDYNETQSTLNFPIEWALCNAENVIKNKYNIDLSEWFENYEEYTLPVKEVEKLKRINIKFNIDNINSDGSLTVSSADDFFEIWKQLIEKADINIKIDKVKLKSFTSKCSGYGLFYN